MTSDPRVHAGVGGWARGLFLSQFSLKTLNRKHSYLDNRYHVGLVFVP